VVNGEEFTLEGAQLKEALQYSPTLGLPSLLKHLDALRQAYHAPVHLSSTPSERADADMEAQADSSRYASMVSTGSQVGLVQCITLFAFLALSIRRLGFLIFCLQHSVLFFGGQDALSKAFEMLLNPGDHLLVEAPTYRY